MKRIILYIGIMLAMVSCTENDTFEQPVTPADSGVVRFSIATPKNTTSEEYNPMDKCTVRVYKYTDTTDEAGEPTRIKELIRLYKSAEAVPAQLALLAGDYAVRVDVGSKAVTTLSELSYRGEADFTVEPGLTTPVKVDCKMLNSVVQVIFDSTIAQKLNLEAYADICIGEEYDAAGVKAGKVPYLRFEDNGTGYFLMPEGETTLNWFFHGKSDNEEIGTVEKSGIIENVAAATKYTLTFKYSKSVGGTLSFEVDIDTTEEIINDKIAFSPDPTVKGDGFDPEQVQYVLNSNYTFNIAALANINLLTLTMEGATYDLLNDTVAGISVVQNDEKHYDIIFSPDFFAAMAGGNHDMLFKVTDQDGGEAQVPAIFCTQGVAHLGSNYDLWFNTADFTGVVFDPAATSVVVKYRLTGGSWSKLTAQASSSANIYTAQATDFAAGKSYEYALFVNGEQVGGLLSINTPVGAQIPEADLENWTSKDDKIWCPTSSLLSATWDTGNHATGSLDLGNLTNPSDDIRPGSAGKKSAYMKSMKAAIMGIGKFAAGNLFVGKFVQIDGMGGVVDFGKPFTFTARPKAVRMWVKYHCGTINEGSHTSGIDLTKIFICLCDRTEPYRVNTNESETLFDPATAPNVIANGIFESKTSATEWHELTIPIEYKDNNTKPNFLVLTLTCSGYGDYFTGSTDSYMYVDDIELVY